jgi:hypothetical protein
MLDKRKCLVTLDEQMMMPDGLFYICLYGTANIVKSENLLGFKVKAHAEYTYIFNDIKGEILIGGCRLVKGILMPDPPPIYNTNRTMLWNFERKMAEEFYYPNVYVVNEKPEQP